MQNKQTSWGKVADWYDGLLEDSDDSYQNKVLLPNIMRLLGPKKGMTILDVGCGQGYFSRAFAEVGAKVIGCDISPELIKKAVEHLNESTSVAGHVDFKVASSDKLSFAANASFDAATIILSLQNIENLSSTISESARVLKSGGRLLTVMNHPAFRVLKNSSWQWDEAAGKQFRRVDSYMSDQTHKIDMTPCEKDPVRKKMTLSFHRPLQSYFKAFNKAGLAVARLEEWISHRKSQAGPRAAEEDRTRKEIPLFLAIEAVKL